MNKIPEETEKSFTKQVLWDGAENTVCASTFVLAKYMRAARIYLPSPFAFSPLGTCVKIVGIVRM